MAGLLSPPGMFARAPHSPWLGWLAGWFFGVSHSGLLV